MPTYEYECRACGLRLDRKQAVTEEPLSECPSCGGHIRRLVSGGVGFVLKGQGQARPGRPGGGCAVERTGETCCGRRAVRQAAMREQAMSKGSPPPCCAAEENPRT